jgi:hypothetical protein
MIVQRDNVNKTHNNTIRLYVNIFNITNINNKLNNNPNTPYIN